VKDKLAEIKEALGTANRTYLGSEYVACIKPAKLGEALQSLKELEDMLESEEFMEYMQVAIAEEYMLIPKNTPWEVYSERLTQVVLKTIKGEL
jgi:hypothetical protein